MENSYEKSPFYRLFNVVLFILYFFIILITVLAGIIGYSTRDLTSATVACEDGTRWDATRIHDDSYALCGICTQRNLDGSKYNSCDYENISYTSYDVVDKQYAWSWNTIIYPLVVFAIGFGIVDILKITVVYVLSGRIVLNKSILLKVLLLTVSQDNKSKQR